MIAAVDFETWAMSAATGPTPPPVCFSWAATDGDKAESGLHHCLTEELMLRGDKVVKAKEPIRKRLVRLFNEAELIIGQNIMFDIGVALGHLDDGDLLDAVIRALEEGRVYDTMIAQKLMNLQEHGIIKDGMLNGRPIEFKYSLDELAKVYGVLPEGYEAMKHEAGAWRVRYGELAGTRLAQWPKAAVEYPILDAEVTYMVYLAQQKRRATFKHDPLTSLTLRMKAAFALRMTGAFGITVDPVKREEMRAHAEAIDAECATPLIEAGIVVPAHDPQPYKPRGKAQKPVLNPDGTLKMKAAEPEKLNKKALVQHILSLVDKEVIDVADIVLSDKALEDGEFKKAFEKDALAALVDNPEYVSTAAEFMNEHAEKDPILATYKKRQSVQKILTTELPRISPDRPDEKGEILAPNWNCVAWAEYDAMKETGRSSSYASKLFPSLNAQNIHKMMRGCFTCPPGTLILSADFSSMELVTAAQTCLTLFGKSVLADVLTAGKDAHAYLGAQIAYSKWDFFKHVCNEEGATDVEGRYKVFCELKKSDEMLPWIDGADSEKKGKDAFKHFRTLAKPTGLGLWGGLGAETFVTYAKTTYGVLITLEEAKELIQIWHSTFPEAKVYFEKLEADDAHTISRKVKKRKSSVVVDPDGTKRRIISEEEKMVTFTKFSYTTPGGMVRSNADYCAAANGKALQSPSAEGALMALYEVVVECLKDNFFGAVPYAFVHDEILLVVPESSDMVDAAYKKLDEIMVRNFAKYSAPDVPIKTEPGLMRHWNKAAGPDYDKNGHLMTIEEKMAGVEVVER